MRVGILTLHYGLNYGALLQSYTTARLFDGEIVDHRYRRKCRAYNAGSQDRAHLKHFLEEFLPLSPHRFLSPDFACRKTWRYIEQRYKLLICGSDELWKTEYRNSKPWRQFASSLLRTPVHTVKDFAWMQTNRLSSPFPSVYWPAVNVPCVAFAASVGETDIARIPLRHRELMTTRLRQLDLIGVRDTRTRDFVAQLAPELSDQVELVPDPVFTWQTTKDETEGASRVLESCGIDLNRSFAFLHVRPPKRRAEFREQIERAGLQVADLLSMPLSPPQWCAAIGLSDCGVAHAMHPLICSLTHNTPCLSIDARFKSAELRRQFGVDGFESLEHCRSNWPGDIEAKVADKRQHVLRFVEKAKLLANST